MEDLDTLFTRLYQSNAAKNAAIRDIHDKIMELEREMETLSDPFDNEISVLRTQIDEAVKAQAKSYKGSFGKASYRKEYERTSWDTKALTGYAAAHPEIEQFKKTTLVEASVGISLGGEE